MVTRAPVRTTTLVALAAAFGCDLWPQQARDNRYDPGSTFDFDADGIEDNDDCDAADGVHSVLRVSENACGDGIVCPAAGEACDDGYADACGACNSDCTGPGAGSSCGDGEVCPETEACDDGYTDACGACNADCTGPGTGDLGTCGDGVWCAEAGEACDDGYSDACGSCSPDCTGPGAGSTCGDGEICPETEACDDGYTDACGTCNADCTGPGAGSTCGDGEVCPETEVCDDGFSACGTCNADCTGPGPACGDGEVCPETEACDDGYTDACGTCNADCTGPGTGDLGTCGDGVWCAEAGEACDDGYTDACGSCNADCTGAGSGSTCGDGALCPEMEACDDNNRVPGDGCSAYCTVDTGCGDAACNSNAPRFPVSGAQDFSRTSGTETVVTDSLTGLMWQGCHAGETGDCSGSPFPIIDSMTWSAALAYCTGLTWAGYSDWYLPDEYELQTLVDYSRVSPAIDQTSFPYTSCSESGGYWASSSSAYDATYAWVVNFAYGGVDVHDKSYSRLVRCVRRGP